MSKFWIFDSENKKSWFSTRTIIFLLLFFVDFVVLFFFANFKNFSVFISKSSKYVLKVLFFVFNERFCRSNFSTRIRKILVDFNHSANCFLLTISLTICFRINFTVLFSIVNRTFFILNMNLSILQTINW